MNTIAFLPTDPHRSAQALTEDEVHVWLLPLDMSAGRRRSVERLLAEEQHRRAAAFAFPHLRERYIAAHGQMRHILGAYASVPAVSLPIRTTPEGKPYLEPQGSPSFNLSHSDGLGLLGIARIGPLGADIERVRPSSDLMSIARTTFSPDEAAALEQLPAAELTSAFFACWTRKEAVAKADGRGLGVPLASYTVSVRPDAAPTVALDPAAFGSDLSLRLFDIPAPSGYRAAVAVSQAIRSVRLFRLPEKDVEG